MINDDMNNMMERYKRELMEINRKSRASQGNMKVENQSSLKRGESTNKNKQFSRRAIAPLERTVTKDNENYSLENLNAEGEEMKKTRFNSSVSLFGDATKRNSDAAVSEYLDFTRPLTESGTLRVETVSTLGLYPVSNVHVIVYKKFKELNYYIYDSYTDGSGRIKDMSLPAPDKSFSQTPENNGVVPYATYNIYVEHPDFINTLYENVPIFDSIVSIQAVEMIPSNGEDGRKPTIVYEKEPDFGRMS